MTMKSTNPHPNFGHLADCVSRAFLREFDRRLAEAGIRLSAEQCLLLRHIKHRDGTHQSELAEWNLRDKATITRHLDLLERRKLVVRQLNPEDRRQNVLHITPAGNKTLDETQRLMDQVIERATTGIPAAALAQCRDVLTRVLTNLAQSEHSESNRTKR